MNFIDGSPLDPDYLGPGQDVLDDLVEYAPYDYEEPIPPVPEWEYRRFIETHQQHVINVLPTQFVETTLLMPSGKTKKLEPFSFKERPYLRRVYNTPSKRVLLMCGRQVEKTVREDTPVLTASGKHVPIKDLQLGDALACLQTYEVAPGDERGPGAVMTTSEVTWKSARYKKPCVRVHTRQGHSSEMATTHPVRVWGGWKEAGSIQVGDKIAVVRRAGAFSDQEVSEARVKITAFMIGDGSCQRHLAFTSKSCTVLDDFAASLEDEGMDYTFSSKKGTEAVSLRLPRCKAQKMYYWFTSDGLLGTDSYSKFIPDWVFDLSRRSTALFLNRLWSTDGHVKANSSTKWFIEYCSMSKKLVLQVQALLWKFGIPSKIRENWPIIYKRRGEDRRAYILRVETREGVRSFVRDIGALGKIDRHELPAWESNSNTDTYPPEVSHLVREIYDEVGLTKGDRTLRSCGIDRLPRDTYCLTTDKLRKFVEFFREDSRYDQDKVGLLAAHLDADVLWDEVTQLDDLGEQWCYDITVRDHHNFVAGAIVTHNSTTLGNRALAMSCLLPHFRVLYVSPSSTQTKEFSKTRIKEMMETCPDLRVWFPSSLTDNVFEKRSINRSTITLRYAFLNADRTRGLSSDLVEIDEIQDQLLENIPVIEETASHSPYRYFLYSGTPKSLDNPIEHFWQNYSTMNEWVVPCERHGTPKDPGSWHWNVLDESNMGRKGLICDKCGGPIHANHPMARWASTGTPDPEKTTYEGFRIPQLMVPWIEWPDLLAKRDGYGKAQFYNEVLGMSFDSGQRPLTQADIRANCDKDMSLSPESVKKWRERFTGIPLYGGIDWGQDSSNSYTVMFVAGYLEGRFRTIFAHRFVGVDAEPRPQLDKICRIIETFKLQRVGVDHGGGFYQNDELMRKYGSGRIVRFQYSQPNVYMRWDSKLGRYLINRSEVMSAIFNAIKRRVNYVFPRWEDFRDPFAADMLSIFSEFNERMHQTQYKRSPNNTDDSFHSLLFCHLASMLDYERPDIFVPSARIDQQLNE